MCSRRVQFESDKASYLFNWNTRSLQEILQTHCKINTRTIPGLLITFQFETYKHRQICLKCPFSFETPCNIGKSAQYRQYTYLTESLGLSYRELYSSSLTKSIQYQVTRKSIHIRRIRNWIFSQQTYLVKNTPGPPA